MHFLWCRGLRGLRVYAIGLLREATAATSLVMAEIGGPR